MLRFFISIIFLLSAATVWAQGGDTIDTRQVVRKDSIGQLRFGVDVFTPLLFAFGENDQVAFKRDYQFEADYYWKEELYFVGEAGFGGIEVNYDNLAYRTSSSFFKVGINKSMLTRILPGDWDMAFVGARYAMNFINTSEVSFVVTDNFWGSSSGTLPANNYVGVWGEVVGGVKLEVYRGLFIGWTARGKFLVNKGEFQDLRPAYISGYGKGDQNIIFDFSFYVDYAIRWRRHKIP